MPVYELTSPKTGRVYNVDATAELPDDDIDALVNDLDFEAAREAGVQPGVDPAVLQQGPVGSFLQSIPQTFSKVGSGMIGGSGRILDKASESLSQATGLPKGGDMFQRMADYGDELSTSADLTFPTNPLNPVAGTIGSGAAQGLSLLAGGLAGKALTGSNVAMTAVPAASGFLSGANEGIQTAEQIGVQSPLAQLGTGMAFGGLEVLTERLGGIGSKAGTEALTRAVRQTVGQMLRSSGRAVGSEALEEVLAGRSQAALTRLIASEDPNNPGFTRTGVKLDDLASEIVNLEAMKLEALGGAAGGTVFAGVQALANRQLPNDPTTSPNQTPTAPQPPAPGQPGAPAPMAPGAPGPAAVSPLIGIAQRGGAVDVTLPEDTGELTAEEVQDLETGRLGEGETGRLGDLETGRRQPILQGVPDRPQQVAPFRESSINEEPIMEGDAITDLRIPRSPQAIAESQRIEAERQQKIATMRMLDARAQGMPLIPDSPSGSRDILDFANENPIYLPPGFSEERNLPEYEKLKEAKLPPYWRQFVASSKRGGNPSDVAQRAFDAGFIDAPTADAYLEAVRGGIEGRQQYRVQFAQREKALQQEEKRVVDFEQSQDKLARKRSTERVDFEDIRKGDAMTIDGEPAVVRNIEYDQDGYLTNVVIEDGKRFGLMQFDPQTRGGILVDEFQPRPQRSASTPESATPESDLTPGFQHLVIDRDLEAGFMSGAGADALIDLAHRAFAAGRTFAQWAAAMVQRFGAAVRDYLAAVWDHAKRSSQTGALNFTSRLGEQLQQSQQAASRLRNPASRATPAAMASDPGAAQNAEPSPGGLSEAEFDVLKNLNLWDDSTKAEAQTEIQKSGLNWSVVYPKAKFAAERLMSEIAALPGVWDNPATARLDAARKAMHRLSDLSEGDYFAAKQPGYENLRLTLSEAKDANELRKDITPFVLYKGESSFPGIASMRVLPGDVSGVSKSEYPYIEATLTNGRKFIKKIRVSDHDQVSDRAPRYYAIDLRIPLRQKGERRATYDKRIVLEAEDKINDAATSLWENHAEIIKKATSVSRGGLESSTKLGERGSVTVRDSQQPEGAGTIPQQATPSVNPESSRAAAGTSPRLPVSESPRLESAPLKAAYASALRSASTPESATPESDLTPGFQHLVIDRDLEAGFMSGAGADALIDLAHRAFAAGRTFAQWAAAMVQRFGAAVRDYLAAVWDHAKRSSQTGALNFTSRLGEQLQRASQQAARPTATMASDPGAAQAAAAQIAPPSPAPSALAQQWWASTSRAEARAILEPASLEELKAIAVRMDENPNQSKAKLIDRLVQITGVYADAVGIRGADVIGPRGPMPDYTGQTAAAQQRMREQKAARAQQPKERGLPKAKPRTPEEFARDMAALMTTPGRQTVGTMQNSTDLPAATAALLKAAYASALRGSSTAMVPLADVFAAAQAANPALTQEQFQSQVMADYDAGSLMLEGAGSPQEAQNAGLRIDGTPVGTAVRMMVPQGFTHLDVSGRASQRGAVQIDSGTVRQGPNETQSRFASPNPADRVIDGPRTDELVTAEANAWLGSMDQQAAIEAFVAGQVPLSLDTAERAAATLIANLSEQAATAKTEMARMWAHVQGRRMARVWTTEHLSADPARALRQRGVVNNTILAPIAPVLAAQELLEDRAKKVIDQRFDGGTEGAVEKVKDIATKADEQAGTDLAADLEGETTPGAPTRPGQPPRPRKLAAKHPNLKKMLDALRKKMFPGMTWADIFTQLPESQKERQREIYRRLMLDERLRNLTAEERLALTNELDKAWQRERRKVFMRELEKADVLGEAKPKDREKVKAAAPRLLRLMNLGMLNSEMFREALAKEYGLNMIDAAAAADLRALGERIQKAPEGLPRRKLEQQLVERLQKLTGYTLWQVMDSWWTASVLSGWRTQVDIGLSIANGIEDIGLGSIVAALRSGNKDVAVRGLAALFGRIPSAFMEAVNHIATGNKAMMRNFELEVKQAMEGGNQLASDVGRQMWDRGGWRKVPGGFMVFYGRLMTALDHVNSASTREGAKALALARHPDLYEKALRITTADRLAARQQARLEMTGGAPPATQQERIEENARVREILEQGIPAEMLAEATEVGRAAALQGEPTGLGGALLDAVLSAVSIVSRKAESMAKRDGLDPKSRQVLRVLEGAAPLARAITGTKFARTVAHSINRTASYVPGLGAYAVGQKGRTGAFGDILAAKQVIGTLVGIALYLAFDDDDDEKGIEDSWKDKTPQQKAQLYAQGKQPFTIWTRDDQGRVRNWNYQQWGIAGIVNTVAAMLKQKGSEAGTLNVLMSSITQGAMSFTDKAQLQGLQTVFGENFRSTDPASGIAASLNKWAAQTVGGVVPRLVKDIDMVASPELRNTSEWWQKWAKEVPMLRQLSSGKRVDILGQDIKLDRGPLSRVTQLGTADPIYRMLGNLNARDVWLPDPSQGVRVVKLRDGTRRNMTATEKDRYQRLTGAAYRAYLEKEGPALMQMSPEDAQEAVSKATARLRSTAAYQATH